MRLRARWAVAEAPLGNLTALVENEGFVVASCLVGTGKVDALTLRDEAEPAPTMIAVRQDIPGDRMRFALAVELGQLVLGGAAAEEGRQFAYELLLPAQPMRAILRQLTLPRLILLKRHWRCSMASLLARAVELGCIAEPQARALRRQLQESGFSSREPVDIARDEPSGWGELPVAAAGDRQGGDRHAPPP